MRPSIIILALTFSINISAQSIYRSPYLNYIGSDLEFMKITFNGGFPYDGIGKKEILNELPDIYREGMTKLDVPASNFVDAFGLIGPKLNTNNPSNLYLQTDRFGNLSTFFKQYKWIKGIRSNTNQHMHFQKRWKRDLNNNDLLDFHPGHRIMWAPEISHNRGNINMGVKAFYLNAKDWGGERSFDPDSSTGSLGHTKKTDHLQLSFSGRRSFDSYKNKSIDWQFDFNNHDQSRNVFQLNYRGSERDFDGMVSYKQNFITSTLTAGAQFHGEYLNEQLDSFQHEKKYETGKLFLAFKNSIHRKLILKSFANLELQGGNLFFLPSAQLDWGIKKEQLSLSLFGLTGRRMAKPMNFYLDWLAVADNFHYEVNDIEKSQKLGAALNYRSKHQRITSKVSFYRNRYINKAIVTNDDDDILVFKSFGEALIKNTLECLLLAKILYSDESLFLHLIYKNESFSESDIVPFQSMHSVQGRLRFVNNKGLVIEAHHTLKSPQKLRPFLDEKIPVFHRTDLFAKMNFDQVRKISHGFQKFHVGIYFDNFINYYKKDKTIKETGLLLYPFQQDIFWSDPSLANVRLEIGYKFN